MRNEWKNENLREVPQGTWWGRRERAALAKTRDQSVAVAQLLSAVSDWMRETTLCYQLPEEWLKTLKDIKTMVALW